MASHLHDPHNITVFDTFVKASDAFTPHVVATDPKHPHEYTVTAAQEGPALHVDFVEHDTYYIFHA